MFISLTLICNYCSCVFLPLSIQMKLSMESLEYNLGHSLPFPQFNAFNFCLRVSKNNIPIIIICRLANPRKDSPGETQMTKLTSQPMVFRIVNPQNLGSKNLASGTAMQCIICCCIKILLYISHWYIFWSLIQWGFKYWTSEYHIFICHIIKWRYYLNIHL